jgi:membrane-bound lytic murein transglycosylase D
MAATIIAKNPLAYGFTVSTYEPFTYDEIVLEESADLRLIAQCANCTYQEIKELNPEIRRWVTPPHFSRYTLRLPAGRKETFLENYAAVPAEQKIKWERHEVRQGDSLAGLAKQWTEKEPARSREAPAHTERYHNQAVRSRLPVDCRGRSTAAGALQGPAR